MLKKRKKKTTLQALTSFYKKVYKPVYYYVIDNMEFGRVEKIILLYFGIKKSESSNLIKRTHITRDIREILGREDDNNFAVVLNNALRRLVIDKKVLYRRYSRVGINNKGLAIASNMLDIINKNRKEPVENWDDILENI